MLFSEEKQKDVSERATYILSPIRNITSFIRLLFIFILMFIHLFHSRYLFISLFIKGRKGK